MARTPPAAAAVALVAAAFATPARAEIRTEHRDGEIVVTNLAPLRRDGAAPAPAAKVHRIVAPPRVAPGEEIPAGPSPDPILPASPPDLTQLLHGSAARHAFDPALIQAIVAAESAFDHRAVSKAGARGLMQLMPKTADRFNVRDVHDPATNLEAGVAFLRELVGRFQGDVTLALAAYNAGPESVARYGGVPPYPETREYLERIRGYYGPDLNAGDWSRRYGSIHLEKVEAGGVPHFTNLKPRRVVRPAAARGR